MRKGCRYNFFSTLFFKADFDMYIVHTVSYGVERIGFVKTMKKNPNFTHTMVYARNTRNTDISSIKKNQLSENEIMLTF